jgi:hypothetical protein
MSAPIARQCVSVRPRMATWGGQNLTPRHHLIFLGGQRWHACDGFGGHHALGIRDVGQRQLRSAIAERVRSGAPDASSNSPAEYRHGEAARALLVGVDISELLDQLTVAPQWDLTTVTELFRNIHAYPALHTFWEAVQAHCTDWRAAPSTCAIKLQRFAGNDRYRVRQRALGISVHHPGHQTSAWTTDLVAEADPTTVIAKHSRTRRT